MRKYKEVNCFYRNLYVKKYFGSKLQKFLSKTIWFKKNCLLARKPEARWKSALLPACAKAEHAPVIGVQGVLHQRVGLFVGGQGAHVGLQTLAFFHTDGVVGRVAAINDKDDTFVLETTSDRVKIRFRRSAISSVEKLDMGNTAKDTAKKDAPAKKN